jgi:pyrroloquinoline quinone (PQQ) biosynthesis protein C
MPTFRGQDWQEMTEDFLAELEKEFATQVYQVSNGPLVQMAQQGKLTLEHLQEFAMQQYNIVPQEFRHMALSMLRTGRGKTPDDLFVQSTIVDILSVFLAEWEAYQEFVQVLGLTLEDVRNAKVLPSAHYFISWSHYSGASLDPEQHIAFLYMDWLAWSQACAKISRSLQEQHRFPPEKIKYMVLFTESDPKLLERMRKVVDDYAAKSEENKWNLRWVVKLGLEAEKMFWDDIYDFGAKHAPFK